jgi:phosphoribosylanthranilate isomerase
MNHRLIKICGITNAGDAKAALAAGADLIGLVFVPKTKRYLTIEKAKAILSELKAEERGQVVGLFRDEKIDDVVRTVKELGLKIVQFHGEESRDYIEELRRREPAIRVIKAVAIRGAEDVAKAQEYAGEGMMAVLLDGPGGGGMGEKFDWQAIAERLKEMREKLPPIFLAGGLSPENIESAIKAMQPNGVDVSSGVETAAGKKDGEKVRLFIRLARKCQ